MKYETEFTLTGAVIKVLKAKGFSMVCARQGCGVPLKVGDRVVSLGGGHSKRKYLHKSCRELQYSPRLRHIILDEGELTESSMREMERVLKVYLRGSD